MIGCPCHVIRLIGHISYTQTSELTFAYHLYLCIGMLYLFYKSLSYSFIEYTLAVVCIVRIFAAPQVRLSSYTLVIVHLHTSYRRYTKTEGACEEWGTGDKWPLLHKDKYINDYHSAVRESN